MLAGCEERLVTTGAEERMPNDMKSTCGVKVKSDCEDPGVGEGRMRRTSGDSRRRRAKGECRMPHEEGANAE